MNNIEQVILHNLIKDENFARKVSPFLLKEYFHNFSERFIFETVRDYFLKYNGLPTKEALIIILDKEKNLTEVQVKDISDVVESITSDADKVDLDWLTKETTSSFTTDGQSSPISLGKANVAMRDCCQAPAAFSRVSAHPVRGHP